MSGIRLHKFMAQAGVASRRKCEEMIAQGRVRVDGRVVLEPGTKIRGVENVIVDGVAIRREEKVYILLNKPAGYISSARDQFSRKTVLDLVGAEKRIYPVGRLDYETSGLIILTNDGEFAHRMTHPSHMVKKTYHAIISGMLNPVKISSLERGVDIDGVMTAPAAVRVLKSNGRNSEVEITIHEGMNRQVRRMFESVGHRVIRLKRVAIGPVGIEGLEEGKWRYLEESEIKALNEAASQPDIKTSRIRNKASRPGNKASLADN